MERTLRRRRNVLPVLGTVVVIVVLLAAHTIERRDAPAATAEALRAFAFCSEAVLVLVSIALLVPILAPRVAHFWPLTNYRFNAVLRAGLVWALSLLVTLSSPSRRYVLLGLGAGPELEQEPCEEGAATQWIAIFLGFVAALQQLPFVIYAPLSQFICLQHLILAVAVQRDECRYDNIRGPGGPLLGLSPPILSGLQLHVLAGLFGYTCWRSSAEPVLVEAAKRVTSRKKAAKRDEKDKEMLNWVEVVVKDIRSEELTCLQLLSEVQKTVPVTETSCAWFSSMHSMIGFLAKLCVKLQAHSSSALLAGARPQLGDKVAAENSTFTTFMHQTFMGSDMRSPAGREKGAENGKDEADENNPDATAPASKPDAPTCSGKGKVAKPKKGGNKKARFASTVNKTKSTDVPMMDFQNLDIGEWHFNSLKVEGDTGMVIGAVGHKLLDDFGCIKRESLAEFLNRLTAGYVKDNPYHSHIHAADVCNAMYYLVTTIGLWYSGQFGEWKRVSVLLAALGHDLGHFGRTNNYLIATRHNLATTYNDKSVLESFHTASLFKLLDKDRATGTDCCDAERGVDLLATFSRDEYRQARQLIIALILATDTSHHLEDLANFRVKLNSIEALEEAQEVGINRTMSEKTTVFDPVKDVADQQEALAILIRAADIGHSAKRWDMHYAWSTKVTEEFHNQGDEEQRLGLPISPLCGREGFVLASSQMGFLQFICLPTWTALARLEAHLHVVLEEELMAEVTKRSSAESNVSIVISGPAPAAERSITRECLDQCDANFQEWKRQADEIKAAKEEAEKKGKQGVATE